MKARTVAGIFDVMSCVLLTLIGLNVVAVTVLMVADLVVGGYRDAINTFKIDAAYGTVLFLLSKSMLSHYKEKEQEEKINETFHP